MGSILYDAATQDAGAQDAGDLHNNNKHVINNWKGITVACLVGMHFFPLPSQQYIDYGRLFKLLFIL